MAIGKEIDPRKAYYSPLKKIVMRINKQVYTETTRGGEHIPKYCSEISFFHDLKDENHVFLKHADRITIETPYTNEPLDDRKIMELLAREYESQVASNVILLTENMEIG